MAIEVSYSDIENLGYHNHQIKEIVDRYRELTRGKLVRLTRGRYKGRIARIDGAAADGAEVLFLCMVLRADGSGETLNTDGETRTYRPIKEFEFV